MSTITETHWHGFQAWQMENEALRVIIVPELGAKIASLYDKAADYEWLAAPTNPVRKRAYGDTFTDHDLAGWDEMFPTIVPCPSPHDSSVELPDHGEVWALPWTVKHMSQMGQGITLAVQGVALPYTLSRKSYLVSNWLWLDYTLTNDGDQAIPFLWAAHPLFRADDQTQFILPPSIQRVVSVADHPVFGKPDTPYAWPLATLPDGTQQRIDRMGPPSRKDYRKFYTSPDDKLSAAGIMRYTDELELNMFWVGLKASYLGLWVDEGTYTSETTIALEPATGYYDSLQLAIDNDHVSVIQVGETVNWQLRVGFGFRR